MQVCALFGLPSRRWELEDNWSFWFYPAQTMTHGVSLTCGQCGGSLGVVTNVGKTPNRESFIIKTFRENFHEVLIHSPQPRITCESTALSTEVWEESWKTPGITTMRFWPSSVPRESSTPWPRVRILDCVVLQSTQELLMVVFIRRNKMDLICNVGERLIEINKKKVVNNF